MLSSKKVQYTVDEEKCETECTKGPPPGKSGV